MRWLFADPHHPEEAACIQQKLAAIDAWWQQFQEHAHRFEAYFEGRDDWDVDAFLEEWLLPIDRRLVWELMPHASEPQETADGAKQPGGVHRLILTTEGARTLRPLLRTVVQRAPSLPNWQFLIYRPAELVDRAAHWVRMRAGIDLDGALLEVRPAPGRKIDLHYYFPGHVAGGRPIRTEQAWLVTEALLGEQVLDTWVGEIGLLEGEQLARSQPMPLAHAQAMVVALIRRYQQQLPVLPLAHLVREAASTPLTLPPPPPAPDYPEWTDLVQATTRHPELFQATHSGQPFTSACHSRHGELFGYLKIDRQDSALGEVFTAPRLPVELALRCDALLRQARLGCVYGEGAGLRYAYVELALTDPFAAVAPLRALAAEQALPPRAWLLWHDDDLAEEWVGLHPHSPPPPAAED